MKYIELHLHGGGMAFKDTVLTLTKIRLAQSPSSEQQQAISFTFVMISWTCLSQKREKLFLIRIKRSFLPLVGKSCILCDMILSFFFVFYQIFKEMSKILIFFVTSKT
jgi:hypothetical protein